MDDKYLIGEFADIGFESPDDARYWFGYYNYCPLSAAEDKLLCHRWDSDDEERNFLQDDTIDVGWFSLPDGEWHRVATTRACNWQQGAMSQWINYDGKERIIFNDVEGDKYVSRICEPDGTLVKTLLMPIYGISPDASFSITMNFERAYWCRAYHYEYIRDERYNAQVTDVDGIYKMDLQTGEAKKIIDIGTIINTDYREEFAGAKHWVEHIMLSPSGTRFAFYHRFDAGTGFRTRCFIADIEGNILTCLKGWESNSWSHLGWIDDESFVIFSVRRRALGGAYTAVTQKSGAVGKLLRKIYRKFFAKHVSVQAHHKLAASSCYDIYGTDGKKKGSYDTGKLVIDGHPSFTHGGRYMLTDTYADEENYRNLLIFDTKTEKLHTVARFESPINATAYRSDLHPRFGRSSGKIVVDSAHTGKHKIMVVNVNWNEMEK